MEKTKYHQLSSRDCESCGVALTDSEHKCLPGNVRRYQRKQAIDLLHRVQRVSMLPVASIATRVELSGEIKQFLDGLND